MESKDSPVIDYAHRSDLISSTLRHHINAATLDLLTAESTPIAALCKLFRDKQYLFFEKN